MATKVISEIESFSPLVHFKIGVLTLLTSLSILFLLKNLSTPNDFKFTSYFNYVEGLEVGSDVVIAGIVVGEITEILLKDGKILVNGSIKKEYPIPSDSIASIRSNGIFGKKSLLIEPGFDDMFERSSYVFINTKDSYSIDMFLRYLNKTNE